MDVLTREGKLHCTNGILNSSLNFECYSLKPKGEGLMTS